MSMVSSTESGAKAQDNIGGWHDAGTYGRYMVNSGHHHRHPAVGLEIYGKKLKGISLQIPESGTALRHSERGALEPGVDAEDAGRGWRRLAQADQRAIRRLCCAPDDKLPSEVIGTGRAPFKSTCATADLAAVGAIARGFTGPMTADFAVRRWMPARRAWTWAEKNPDVTFRNPQGVGTANTGTETAGTSNCGGGGAMADHGAKRPYHEYFLTHYEPYLATLDSPPAENWNSVGRWPCGPTRSRGARSGGQSDWSDSRADGAAAHAVEQRTRSNPYRVSLQTKDYVWGSNGVAAGYGMYLLIANQFSPEPGFVDAARDNLHYLLGRNTFSLSWVTQVGENPFGIRITGPVQ